MGSVFRQKGRAVWMIKYYRDGKAIYESSGTDIKDDARGILRQREGAIANGVPLSAKSHQLLFDEVLRDVESDYTTNGRRSIANLKSRIKLHVLPAFKGRRVSKITTADIRRYATERLEAGASHASVNRELAIIKRAFTLATRAGLMVSKPHVPMLEERNVRKGFFEPEQVEAVIRHLPDPLKPMMTFAACTGWRVLSEVRPLTWAQVDERNQLVRLEPDTTKNREARTFPYGELPDLVKVIAKQKRSRDRLRKKGVICPLVFHREGGDPIGKFYAEWHAACKKAGIPGRIPHDFRRTAVRNLVRAGVSERIAMQLTGHKTRSIFDRYDVVVESDLKAAVSKLATVPIAKRSVR